MLVIVLSGLQITSGQEKVGDAKGVIRSRNLKARQNNHEKKKDNNSLKMPKGAIRSRNLKA
jgi:hypothetical protein